MGYYDHIQFVVMEGHKANAPLRRWIEQFKHHHFQQPLWGTNSRDMLAVWRNQTVIWALEQRQRFPEIEYLAMFDDDMVPLPDTRMLLDVEALVASCHFVTKTGVQAHAGVGGRQGVNVACCKIHLDVFALMFEMGLIPFLFHFDPKHQVMTLCECAHFTKQLEPLLLNEKKVQPERAGRMGHLIPTVVYPFVDPNEGGFATAPLHSPLAETLLFEERDKCLKPKQRILLRQQRDRRVEETRLQQLNPKNTQVRSALLPSATTSRQELPCSTSSPLLNRLLCRVQRWLRLPGKK